MSWTTAAREFLRWPACVETADGVTLDVERFAESRQPTVDFVRGLVGATTRRAPRLGCFGLREWSMVYRQRPEQVRHNAWPLRLGSTDAVVDASRVGCGHFDAFRFFTPDARPHNTLQPTKETQVEFEQPDCLHVSMDLFKWSYKLDPATPSELVAEVRELDMRASPYNLAPLGYEPVPIETPEGRAEYVRQQASFTARAAPLRAELLELSVTLSHASSLKS